MEDTVWLVPRGQAGRQRFPNLSRRENTRPWWQVAAQPTALARPAAFSMTPTGLTDRPCAAIRQRDSSDPARCALPRDVGFLPTRRAGK